MNHLTTAHLIEGAVFDEERALYALTDTTVRGCTFDGPADGESALKEARNVQVEDCRFCLRYPFWHTERALVRGCTLTEGCRAALWYSSDVRVEDTALGGIKALRECDRVTLARCSVRSAEFGWLCRDLTVTDTAVEGEYPFFMTRRMQVRDLRLKGKHSFQYTRDCTVADSELDTKDAFWHARGVTVRDSVLRGEYLGWYSEGLTLIRCHIVGTQPLCYCRGLTLIDCTTEGCDLAFENSEVEATVRGDIESIKSPASGHIVADRIGAIIRDCAPTDGQECRVESRLN